MKNTDDTIKSLQAYTDITEGHRTHISRQALELQGLLREVEAALSLDAPSIEAARDLIREAIRKNQWLNTSINNYGETIYNLPQAA